MDRISPPVTRFIDRRRLIRWMAALVLAVMFPGNVCHRATAADRPNVLFIIVDDLNDWMGCLGGHPQALTPNIDRFASTSALFTNAHCVAPACNPSRTAIFTGISPHKSGLYANGQPMREVLPDAELIPKTFSRHGYHSAGSGKLLHYFIDAPSWDEYFPEAKGENPFPRTLMPEKRPVSLPLGGPWQYTETDWAALDATDDEYGGDVLVAEWISEQLSRERDQPFFLACGIYRPHEPWFVPRKYFEPFPLESIQLPPGYREDDLDDLPPEGKRRGPNRYFAHIQQHDQWKPAIQAYLASIHFADAMVGRVLNALQKGPHRENTIVVLCSDHGWHLGEKQHWQKYTGWRVCTRVPLIIHAPRGTPGLSDGTVGESINDPVSLLSLFPTLLELCGLPSEEHHDGHSLIPLLRENNPKWPHAAITYLADPGSYAITYESVRYIHYANGDEEMYDTRKDPYEWNNLATDPGYQKNVLPRMRASAPRTFAEKPLPSVASLPELKFHPVAEGAAPASQPDGRPFDVYFVNHSGKPVTLHWVDRNGVPKRYARIPPGARQPQQTRPGAVWEIHDEDDRPLGHFRILDRSARAVIQPQAAKR